MGLTKRQFIGAGGLAALSLTAGCGEQKPNPLAPSSANKPLKPMTDNAAKITAADHAERVSKAQRLMRRAGIHALV